MHIYKNVLGWAKSTAAVLVVLLGVASCGSAMSRPKALSRPKAPQSLDAYTKLPFKKAINPAFAHDVSNKYINFRARFGGQVTRVMDLPEEYRAAWVRVGLLNTDSLDVTANVVVPKAKSDVVFDLKVNDEVDVFAFCVPLVVTNAAGHTQSTILFEVQEMRKAR